MTIDKKYAFIGVAAFIAVTPGCVQAKSSENSDESKGPNLLFIFADQYRRASLGFLDEDPVVTPNIDKLAGEGMFFSRAMSNNPISSPYRAMLLTGKYSISNGVVTNCNSSPNRTTNYLKPEEICFTDVLSHSGYSVGYVGKWHLDAPPVTKQGEPVVWDTWCPPDRRHGVDFWYSYGTFDEHLNPHYWTNDTPQDSPLEIKMWSPEHEAGVIIDYIKNNDGKYRDNDKSFAMFWSINPPHTPFTQVPERYLEPYKGRSYEELLNRPNVSFEPNQAMPVGEKVSNNIVRQAAHYFAAINGIDEQIGRVLDALREAGMDENTIIIFTSDHGEMFASHGLMHKNNWFAEAVDIPLIVRWPSGVKQGKDDLLISVPDYMPTILGLMGLGENVPEEVEGRDYSGVMRGEAVSRPDYQLFFGADPNWLNLGRRGFKTDRYTFAVFKNRIGKQYFLYDNQNDPYQMENIWGKNEKLDAEMENRLTEILAEMNDPWIR